MDFFPRPVARYVRQDLMLVRAIAMLLTRRRDVRDVEEPIPYSGPLVIILSVVAVTDGIAAFVLHLLLPPSVRLVALVLGIIGLVWLLGFIASLICYPHVVSAERLRLRFSVFHDIVVPATVVTSVHTASKEPLSQKSAERFEDELVMAVSGQANVTVRMDPTSFRSLNPKVSGSEGLARITFFANEATQARHLLQRQSDSSTDTT